MVDGKEPTNQLIYTCTMNLTINQHLETLTFQVTKLVGWHMILEKTWLKKHNPVIDWTRNTVTFSFGHCQANCLPTRSPISTHMPTNNHHISLIFCTVFQYAIKHRRLVIFALSMSAILEPSADPTKHPNYTTNLVPTKYHDLLLLFVKKGANKIPPYRYMDYKIPIGDNKPPMGTIYCMSVSEL